MVNFGGQSGEQLRALVSKIEKLEEEKAEIAEHISETYSQAKGQGFDVAILRKVIALRKKDAEKLTEEEEILDLYKHALGMAGSKAEKTEEKAEGGV